MTTPVITTSLADRVAALIAVWTTDEHSIFSSIADPISPDQIWFLKQRTHILNCLKSMGQFSGDVFAPIDSSAAYASSPRASAHIFATEFVIPVIRVSHKGAVDIFTILRAYTDFDAYAVNALDSFCIQRDIINPSTHEHVGYAFFRVDPVKSSDFCAPFDVIDGSIRTLLFEIRWSDDATPAIQTHLGLRSANALEALAAEEITLFADWNGVDAPTAAQADFLNRRVFTLTSLTGLGQFTDDVFGPLTVDGPHASILGFQSVPVGPRPMNDLSMTEMQDQPITNPDPEIGQVGTAVFQQGLHYFKPWFIVPSNYGATLVFEFRWSDQ